MKMQIAVICCLLVSATAFSQKDYSRWLSSVEIDGKKVQILRMPPEELIPEIKTDVFSIQRDLDRNRKWYMEGKKTESGSIPGACEFIQHRDTTFPYRYYLAELDTYLAWNIVNEKRKHDTMTARLEKQADDARIAEMIKDYTWISPDSVTVRETPDAKSKTIGKLYRLSYVKAFEVEGKEDWAEVSFGENSGYILKKALALTWTEMQLTDEEMDRVKSRRFYYFEPTAAYQSMLDKQTAADERALKAANAGPRRNYIRGPKNGCYYINSNGNKTYVDRGLCK